MSLTTSRSSYAKHLWAEDGKWGWRALHGSAFSVGKFSKFSALAVEFSVYQSSGWRGLESPPLPQGSSFGDPLANTVALDCARCCCATFGVRVSAGRIQTLVTDQSSFIMDATGIEPTASSPKLREAQVCSGLQIR